LVDAPAGKEIKAQRVEFALRRHLKGVIG
jgi:hypothetical protein